MKKVTLEASPSGGYIEQIISRIPATGTLTSLEYIRSTQTIVIEGLVPDRTTLLALRSAIKEIKGVKTVSLPLTNYDSSTNIPFNMTITL